MLKVLDLLVLLCLTVWSVWGHFDLVVNTMSYTNPLQVLHEGLRCCDGFGFMPCQDLCDIYYQYCIRPESPLAGCSTAVHSIIGTGKVDRFNDSTVLGQRHPLTLRELPSSIEGLELYVGVLDDDDPTADELVDYFTTSLSALPIGIPQLMTFTSLFGSMTQELTLNCIAGNMAEHCNLVRLAEPTPVERNSVIPIVSSTVISPSTTSSSVVTLSTSSSLSKTVTSYTISPTPSTPHTPVDHCAGVNCSGNGVCVHEEKNFTCFCQPGFTGVLCSVAVQGDSMAGTIGGSVGALVVLVIFTVLIVMVVVLLVKVRRQKQAKEVQCIQAPASEVYATIDGDEYDGMIKNALYGSQQAAGRESPVHTYEYAGPKLNTTGEDEYGMIKNVLYGLREPQDAQGLAIEESAVGANTYDYVGPPKRPTSQFTMNINEAFDMNPYDLNHNAAYELNTDN